MSDYPRLPKKRGLFYNPLHPWISIPEDQHVQGPIQATDEEIERLADWMEWRMREMMLDLEAKADA